MNNALINETPSTLEDSFIASASCAWPQYHMVENNTRGCNVHLCVCVNTCSHMDMYPSICKRVWIYCHRQHMFLSDGAAGAVWHQPIHAVANMFHFVLRYRLCAILFVLQRSPSWFSIFRKHFFRLFSNFYVADPTTLLWDCLTFRRNPGMAFMRAPTHSQA